MLASTVGSGEAGVRAAAQSARETFIRLGARPFLELLDMLLARSSSVGEESSPMAEAAGAGPGREDPVNVVVPGGRAG